PEAVTEPEPIAAAKATEPEAEAIAAEPETEATAEVPEPAAATEAAEPEAEETAPEAVTEPEPVAAAKATEPEAEAEPVAEEAAPEAVTEAEAEPVAVATGAEPEAEVAETVAAAVAAGEGEVVGGFQAPQGLATAYQAAATALEATHLTGTRAKLYLVLDRSASMRPYYKDGSAQALAEQTLALAAHLDPEDTKVPVVFFSTEVDGTADLTLTDHENKIDDVHAGLGRMGRTSYHVAVEAVLALHEKSSDPTAPALVVFQTDGAPDAKTPATHSLTDAAKNHPAVFFSFVAFGDPENKAFDYLRKLKLANTSHFLAGETPRELTDAEVYEGILATWRP
ncbi:VWA domain-containing protein, partial [Streptomyces sp. NPDC051677]|uniref:VWA domain-containing protein n=1 Tax=Streptomyces sp. NPDC051677 TaxID=3365669 RepID=UPI0037D55117